jgi:small subunit ribosomal protein S21
MPIVVCRGRSDLSEELPRDVPKSSFLPIDSHCAHRLAQFQILTVVRTAGAVGTRIVHIRAPLAPGPLAIGPITRLIEEERRVQVLVRDNNVDQALKVLKKKMQREGVFREMKLRGHYEKPSERRVREGGSHPPRPQARPQKAAARGSAADEASGDPTGPRKRRSRARPSLLISEQP